MKDIETNKYIHKFLEDSNKNCELCGQKFSEHTESDFFVNEEELSLKASKNINSDRRLEPQSQSTRRSQSQNKFTEIKFPNINFPRETLDDFEDPNICRICFSNKLNTSPKASFSCAHEFCQKCVFGYLKNKIENGKVFNKDKFLGDQNCMFIRRMSSSFY